MLNEKQIRKILRTLAHQDKKCFTQACKSGHRERCMDFGHALRGTISSILLAVLEEGDYLDRYKRKV